MNESDTTIIEIVADKMRCDKREIRRGRKTPLVSLARAVAAYIYVEKMSLTVQDAAKWLGCSSHTTVIDAVKKINANMNKQINTIDRLSAGIAGVPADATLADIIGEIEEEADQFTLAENIDGQHRQGVNEDVKKYKTEVTPVLCRDRLVKHGVKFSAFGAMIGIDPAKIRLWVANKEPLKSTDIRRIRNGLRKLETE